jgi:hypothetical protein
MDVVSLLHGCHVLQEREIPHLSGISKLQHYCNIYISKLQECISAPFIFLNCNRVSLYHFIEIPHLSGISKLQHSAPFIFLNFNRKSVAFLKGLPYIYPML